jgi:hypothetical protein
VDLRAGLDDLEKRKFLTLPGLEFRLLGRPARRYRHEYSLGYDNARCGKGTPTYRRTHCLPLHVICDGGSIFLLNLGISVPVDTVAHPG